MIASGIVQGAASAGCLALGKLFCPNNAINCAAVMERNAIEEAMSSSIMLSELHC